MKGMQKGYAEKGEMNRNEKVNMQKKRKEKEEQEKRGNKYNFQEILFQRTHLNKRG